MKLEEIKAMERLFNEIALEEGKCPTSEVLDDYVTGTLPRTLSEAMENHLEGCAVCRELVALDRAAIAADGAIPPKPSWLEVAQQRFRRWKEGVATDLVETAAAIGALLGATPKPALVLRSDEVVTNNEVRRKDPLSIIEQALREAEEGGRVVPTLTLAVEGGEVRFVKPQGETWCLRARPEGTNEWRDFVLVAYAGEHEIARIVSKGLTVEISRIRDSASESPTRIAVQFAPQGMAPD